MSLWFRPKDIQQYEDKRYLEEHLKKMRNKHDNTNVPNAKEGIKLMIWGLVSAIFLSAFDYGLRSYDFNLPLKIFLKIGMIISTAATLQFPLGLYKFIRGYGIKNNK